MQTQRSCYPSPTHHEKMVRALSFSFVRPILYTLIMPKHFNHDENHSSKTLYAVSEDSDQAVHSHRLIREHTNRSKNYTGFKEGILGAKAFSLTRAHLLVWGKWTRLQMFVILLQRRQVLRLPDCFVEDRNILEKRFDIERKIKFFLLRVNLF